MKHIIRDFIILIISYCGLAFLYRQYILTNGPLVRLICFHDVADKAWFESVIKMLINDYNLLTPSEFVKKEFDNNKINILLTFDDGYQTWVDNCLPIMKEYNIKGLFFINSGLLDIAHNQDAVGHFMRNCVLISPKKPLTWFGARQLLESGQTIGGHTINHVRLSGLTKAEANKEISEDKIKHENQLGISLKDFAYPFGTKTDFTKETVAIVTEAGYARQYSSISGFKGKDNLSIPRTLIENNQTISKIKLWINGGYDIFRALTF